MHWARFVVSARLNYVNSILYGTSIEQITRLQRVRNVLARIVVPNRPPGASSPHLLKQLHWLPVERSIKFKIATLTFKAFETDLPYHLTLCYYQSSSASKLLQVPFTNLWFGSHSIRVPAPTLWNSLPHNIRLFMVNKVLCVSQNRWQLSGNTPKTFIFQSEFYSTPATHYPSASDSIFFDFWRFIN